MELSITCVCRYCFYHESKKVALEINFSDSKIYWYCTDCKKKNEIEAVPHAQSLPKIKSMRGR